LNETRPGAFELWVHWIQPICTQPHHVAIRRLHRVAVGLGLPRRRLAVAVQVKFESKRLKPVFPFIGSRVETRRFRAL
jgi:hypothetical protein